eukprot:g33545.t1
MSAASEDRAEPTEDADVLMARLDALRQTAQKRRGELQSLRQECQQVEEGIVAGRVSPPVAWSVAVDP